MATQMLSVLGPADLVEELSRMLRGKGLDAGEPEPADALADAADSPLGPDEIQAALHFVSVVLDSATSVVTFVTAMIELLKKGEDDPKLQVLDARTGKPVAVVDARADTEAISRQLQR